MKVYFLIFIFILFFTVKSFAVQIDCGIGSDLLINNSVNAVGSYSLNTVNFVLPSRGSVVVGCAGINDITLGVNVVYLVLSLNNFNWNLGLSFLAGLFAASAFVVSAGRML